MSTGDRTNHGSRGALAVLGAGKMGTSLLTAIGKSANVCYADIRATVKHSHRAASLPSDARLWRFCAVVR